MSSLLAYGQGLLSEDIGSGVGLTEPWVGPSTGWRGEGSGEETPKGPAKTEPQKELADEIFESEEGAPGGGPSGLDIFFSVILAEDPSPDAKPKSQDAADLPEPGPESGIVRASTKDLLHWDSPPQSPVSSFVHLPLAFLTTVAAGTKADLVLVGVFQGQIGSNSIVETFFCLPKELGSPEYVTFKPELLACVSGELKSTENLRLPDGFSQALGSRPEAFLASRFHMQTFDGIILGLWRDFSRVTPTAEAVFADCVKCLPVMLSNRFNVKKYDLLSRRFDAILKVIPDAVVFVADEDAQVVINHAAATLLGLPNHGEVDPYTMAGATRKLIERCISRTCTRTGKRIDPQHWPGLLSKDNGEVLELEEDWVLKDPRCVLHVRSYPVGGRTAHGQLWIYEDITSQKDAEKEMEDAIKAKSQFLAMMSHELRTPMTGVLGMLDLLHLTDLGEEQQMLLRIMQESAEGLMDVINNILDYCKIEAGRVQLEDIDFSLSEVMEQMQAMLKTSLLKKALKLTFCQERCGINIVRGDPVRLRQILLNLVSNAIKFTEDGNVSVSWRFLDPQWEDTTVVATSQASSRKSKLINQIINVSRGEKCTVEHSNAGGRSKIVVNFSTEGAAGPYLESSSIRSSQFPRLRQFSDANHPVVHLPSSETSMTDNRTTDARIQSSGPLSFPVSYSLQPEGRKSGRNPVSAPMPSQIAETRYSFTERKCIAGKESSRNSEVSSYLSSSSKGTSSTVTWVGSTATTAPYTTQTARFGGESLQLDEAGAVRPTKYRRLSLEGSSGSLLHQQSQQSPASTSRRGIWDHEHFGIDTYPRWRLALNSSPGALKSQTSSWNPSEDSSSRSSIGIARQILEERGSDTGHDETQPWAGTFPLERGERSLIPGSEAASTGVELHQSVCDESPQKASETTREETKWINPDDKVWLQVRVSDTGVGIGQDQLKRLFVGSHGGSERRNATGTGLGLSIVKGLLCLMNGKIQIDSKIGEGTTVLMTVPLLPAANEHLDDILQNNSIIRPSTREREALRSVPDAKPLLNDLKFAATPESTSSPTVTSSSSVVFGDSETTSLPESVEGKHEAVTNAGTNTNAGIIPAKAFDAVPDAETTQKGQKLAPSGQDSSGRAPISQKLRILVAEDNRVNQLLIRKMFRHLGQEDVEMVGNGKLAIEAVQRSTFDLVLMDVQMPILDGLSAVKAIRGLHPPVSQLPIYALSADAPGSGPLSETGLDGYLKKPIVWSTISDLLARTASSKDTQA